MEFRSTLQIHEQVRALLPQIAGRFDFVAGCSDQAMLVAHLFALHLRVPALQIDAEHRPVDTLKPQGKRGVLVELFANDSEQVLSSRGIASSALPCCELSLVGLFATQSAASELDLTGEILTCRPSFEWNFLHRDGLERVCVDMDGVLCEDPIFEQNDDGPRYLEFLESARPLYLPTMPIGWVVSSRLEKYRQNTEDWLAKHGVIYDELYLLDLPDMETRRALKCHGSFKSDIYASVNSDLFIESDMAQAAEIASRSGKSVFCTGTMKFANPMEQPFGGIAQCSISQKNLYKRARSFTKRLIYRE